MIRSVADIIEVSFTSAIIISFVALFNFSTTINSEGQLSQPMQNGQQQQPSDTFKTYDETINGTNIRIQIPSTWIVGSPASPRHIMVFDSPEVNSYGKHIAEIRVGIDDSPLSLNLTEYLNNEISTYQNNPDFGDFQLVYATADTHLSGYPAIFLGTAYTDSSTGIRYAAFEIGSFFNDNKFYFVYASIEADQIANYLPQLQTTLRSFETSSEDIGAGGARGGEQGQPTNPQSTQENTIIIPQGAAAGLTSQYFQPSSAQISTDDSLVTISWVNQDSVTHTATADNGLFDTAGIAPGASNAVIVPTQKVQGETRYHCNIHPFMTGELRFSSAAG